MPGNFVSFARQCYLYAYVFQFEVKCIIWSDSHSLNLLNKRYLCVLYVLRKNKRKPRFSYQVTWIAEENKYIQCRRLVPMSLCTKLNLGYLSLWYGSVVKFNPS